MAPPPQLPVHKTNNSAVQKEQAKDGSNGSAGGFVCGPGVRENPQGLTSDLSKQVWSYRQNISIPIAFHFVPFPYCKGVCRWWTIKASQNWASFLFSGLSSGAVSFIGCSLLVERRESTGTCLCPAGLLMFSAGCRHRELSCPTSALDILLGWGDTHTGINFKQ